MKKLAFLLALMMLLGSFTACASSGTPGANESEADGQTADTGAADVSYAGTGLDSTDNPNVVAYVSDPPSGLSETSVPDTLTAAMGGEPLVLYPQGQSHMPTLIADLPMYETLVVYNTFTGEYEGCLAESWEMMDDETIRIHLRKGVICHAGYEFTASDVLWTAKQGVASPKANYLWSAFDVDRFEIIDDYTIDMRTYGAFGPAIAYLADTSVAPMCDQQAYEEQTPEDYGRNPTGGTGPYKFVEWVAGDRIVYERFEDYWGEKPYYKNYVLRNIPDDVSRALSLEAGEVDMIYGVDPASCQTLIDAETVNLITCPSYQMIYACFNLNVEPLNNKLIRKAMRYALDMDSMVDLAFSGRAIVADSFFLPSLSCYIPFGDDEEDYTYDVEKAKQLMAEAGYPDGFEVELWTADTTAWMQLAEMMQNAWAEIGITVNVTVMDIGSLWAGIEAGEHEMYIARASCSGDEANWWRTWLYSGLTYYDNTSQYNNPRYDELMDAAKASVDTAFRQQCYAEVQSIVRDDLPWITCACPMMMYGIRSTLHGVAPHPYGSSDPRYIRPIGVE